MNDTTHLREPAVLAAIQEETRALGFRMGSDLLTGALLRTLAASKPAGALLELGTGTGLSAAWLLSGMDSRSTLMTVDHDAAAGAIARRHLAQDARIRFQLAEGAQFLKSLQGQAFDLIFADTWPGKYDHLEEALALVKPGGLYIVDDMLPQPNWPDGHDKKAAHLIDTLEQHDDLALTKLNWSTGLILCTKRSDR